MEAKEIYHKLRDIAEPITMCQDQLVAFAKWIEAEFDYNPRKKFDKLPYERLTEY